jgi:hypothetical protein
MLPRLLDREILPGSVENGDPDGTWIFRFDPAKHDTSAKTLFKGTPYEINVPAGRSGASGLQDALQVVQGMVDHPSTKEFICIKLIQRFVSDEISLAALKAGTVPQDLQALLAACIAAWDSTSPKGDIREVLRVILDPAGKSGPFWSERAYRTKVKTPVEFVNSTVRVLDGAAAGTLLAQKNKSMGMELFVRDDPDGWPELGSRWIDTASMLARMDFCQGLAENESGQLGWSTLQYLSGRGIDSAQEIVDYFDELMFQGTLTDFDKGRLLEFLTTDEAYGPLPLTPGSPDYQRRVQEFTGLLLSLPQWHFQ